MFALRRTINKASGGGRLVLALIFGLSVAFSYDLGALYTDYYQGLAARNQLLNVNDSIINRQYRIEKKCADPDVATKKDSRAFVILNGGCHEFDKGTDTICDKSNNLGFVLGYEKSCNENLTLGAFAGYSNTDYKQKGKIRYVLSDGRSEGINVLENDGDIRSGVFGAFCRCVKENLTIHGLLSGCYLHYNADEFFDSTPLISHRKGYSVGSIVDVRYNFSKNEKFAFGPFAMLSYCYIGQKGYLSNLGDGSGFFVIKRQTGKTLLGEIGVYGTYDYSEKTIPIRMYSAIAFAGVMKKPDAYTSLTGGDNTQGNMHVTPEPSSYINIKFGVTSAVSESIDLNADVNGLFAKDYYDVMGAVGMSYTF